MILPRLSENRQSHLRTDRDFERDPSHQAGPEFRQPRGMCHRQPRRTATSRSHRSGVGLPDSGAWSQVPVDAYHLWVEETTIRIKIAGGTGTVQFAGIGDLSALFQNRNLNGKVYVNYTYLAGWPNSFTSLATGMAGDTSLTVVDPTGFMQGMETTIWDGIGTETNFVSSVSGNVITFTSPLLYNHGFGVNVTTLPASVQQACMHFIIGMVKSRGQGGIVISSDGSAEAVGSRADAISNDEALAYDLLDQFTATWGRS